MSNSTGRPDVLRSVTDTALWAAAYRARETESAAPLFNDPYARGLAGKRGEELARMTDGNNPYAWMVPVRTYLMDRLIEQALSDGVELVMNLAAGLDTRPYRMNLPASLQWIEVDSEELFAHKLPLLRSAQQRCSVEHVVMDIADRTARRDLFEAVRSKGGRKLVITEGLLIYLAETDVESLARDLAGIAAVDQWILDMQSRSLQMALQRGLNAVFGNDGAWLRFAPRTGSDFFAQFDWSPLQVQSMMSAAAAAGRVPREWAPSVTDGSSTGGAHRMDAFVCCLRRTHAQSAN